MCACGDKTSRDPFTHTQSGSFADWLSNTFFSSLSSLFVFEQIDRECVVRWMVSCFWSLYSFSFAFSVDFTTHLVLCFPFFLFLLLYLVVGWSQNLDKGNKIYLQNKLSCSTSRTLSFSRTKSKINDWKLKSSECVRTGAVQWCICEKVYSGVVLCWIVVGSLLFALIRSFTSLFSLFSFFFRFHSHFPFWLNNVYIDQ